MRLLSLAAAALAALLLTIALASAQGPPESQTVTRLEPGLNLVGWVGETASVSQLFNEIPQLESVWAWDAELDDWIVAGRAAPEWLGGLGRVTAGMGLRFVLGGEESFLWQRPTEPTRGLVKLRTGWNLVAWSGADGAPIEQVAKGIGWSLRELRRWNAANQQWTTWTSPERSAQLIATNATDQGATDEEAKPPTVRRGEALWVNTTRSVNWLQPTNILPRLVFPGGASDELQARVREDLEAVLAFYGQQYGIQADPNFTIYVAKDVEALIQAQKDDGDEIDDAEAARIRALWNRVAGWGGGEIVVKQASWPEDLSTSEISWGRYTLTHEYFHILQDQLSDSWASQWLVEGTADWVEGGHQVLDGEQMLEDLRERELSELSPRTPTLRSAEQDNATWQYTLGWLAIDRLTTAAGSGSYIEFWRRLASTEIGPHGRWTSTPDWRTAFQETFGLPVSSFYAEFDAWQRGQAAASGAGASPDDNTRWIRGRVIDEDGAPVGGVFVNAIRVEGETSVGWQQRAETGADGAFAVRAPEDGDYRVSVDIGDCATHYYSNGPPTEEPDEVLPITVAGSDRQGVNIQLPANICGWLIRGRVADVTGEPFAGASITICETTTHTCTWNKGTNLDGSFAISAPSAGEYRLWLDLADGCTIYYRSSGEPTLDSGGGTPIPIADNDVNGLRLQVPSELCSQRVVGSIEGIERFLNDDVYVSVQLCQIVDTWCGASTGRALDRDGSFAVATPTAGSYRISYSLGGCSLHYGLIGLTSNAAEAMRFDAGDRDVRISHRRVPGPMCAYQINGTIVGADGAPLTETWVSACEQVDGECASSTSGWTDSDGSFAITVPVDGAYRLSFSLDGCTVYFGQGRLTSNVSDAWLTRMAGRDVQLSQRQVPAGLCSQQISGRLVNAAGEPLAQTSISICQIIGDECATWLLGTTDVAGSFAVTVPTAGAYRLNFNLNGCSIYYRAGSLTTRQAEASRINVTESDSPSLQLHVPAGMCAHQITGSVTKADGTPLTDTRISACREVDDQCEEWAGSRTDDDGSFAITVPADGRYRVSFSLEGCTIYFRAGGFTTMRSERSTARVAGGDAQLSPRQIPEGMCAHQITGSVTRANGQPLADTYISACREVDDQCGEWAMSRTNDGGAFAVTVPADGRYQVSFLLENCGIYFRAGGFTTSRSEHSTVRVAGRDARLSPRQIPEGMCARRIVGRFVDANGAPLVDKWIYANGSTGSGSAVQTDANGGFEIRVSSDDAYHFSIELRRQPYCWRNLEGRALGSSDNPVRVRDADVTGIMLRLPGTVEELCG